MTGLSAHHVGTTVRDLDRAVEFYRDVLGFEVLAEFTVSGESFATGVGVPGATGEFVHLDAGGVLADGESEGSGDERSESAGVRTSAASAGSLEERSESNGVRIELIEYDPEGEDCTADSVNQPGAKHLGLEVDDVEAFYADLPDDVETVSEPQTTSSGAQILFIRDPEDNLIEIITP